MQDMVVSETSEIRAGEADEPRALFPPNGRTEPGGARATVSETVESRENGRVRGENGRFVKGGPGGPGRSKARPDSTTLDARLLRKEIIASFYEPDPESGEPAGMVALRRLRDDSPVNYLKLVASLLPKPAEPRTRSGVRALAELVQQRQVGNGDGA